MADEGRWREKRDGRWGWTREREREGEENLRDIIPVSSFPPRGCNVISTKIFLVGVSLRLSVCIHLEVCVCVRF